MPDLEKTPSPRIAEYLNEQHARLESLFKKAANGSTIAFGLSAGMIVIIYVGLLLLTPSSPNPELISALRDSIRRNETEIAGLIKADAKSKASQVNSVVSSQQLLRQNQEALLARMAEASPGISGNGYAIMQFVGASAIFAVLAYLGLQRLQNFDAEIQGLRQFMFSQIKERSEDTLNVLGASVKKEVDEAYSTVQDELANLSQTIETRKKEFDVAAANTRESLETIEGRVTRVLEKYSWLGVEEARAAAEAISSIKSVQQAHDICTRLRESGDSETARRTLEIVATQSLPGSVDDFHNTHVEAMRINEPELARRITEAGLRLFPNQFELVPDYSVSLLNCGDAEGAIRVLDKFRHEYEKDFFRSWRSTVFYAQAMRATTLDSEKEQKLLEVFDAATRHLTYDPKIWSSFARYHIDRSSIEEAEKVLRQGISRNPFSQELHFVLGELLLSTGRPEDAIVELSNAVNADYQEQFQHDVNQEAVIAMLAQAYEAAGKTPEAVALYQRVLRSAIPGSHVRRYCLSRLAAQGESPSIVSSHDSIAKLYEMLQRSMADDISQDKNGKLEEVSGGVVDISTQDFSNSPID